MSGSDVESHSSDLERWASDLGACQSDLEFGDPIRAGVHRKWVAEAVYEWGAEKEEAL